VVGGQWDSRGGGVFERADMEFWKMIVVPDRLQCSSFDYITRRILFGGRQVFAELNYRTFLDRKVTKRDKKGTKQDEILPFWEEN
jgi:hypothetical protein